MADKTDAWMPLWIGAYLADTQHLSRDEHGGYLLLLMAYWRAGAALPDDDKRLAAIVKASPKEWKAIRPTLAEFFTVGAGVWTHKRVEHELTDSLGRKAKASSKGKAGADARWGHRGDDATGNAPGNATGMPQAKPKQCPTPSPTPHPSGDSVPIGTGGAAADKRDRTPAERRKSELWRGMKEFLVESGESKDLKAAGAVITATITEFDEATALSGIEATLHARPAGAIAYLKGACQQAAGQRQNKQELLEAGNLAAAHRFVETLQ